MLCEDHFIGKPNREHVKCENFKRYCGGQGKRKGHEGECDLGTLYTSMEMSQ